VKIKKYIPISLFFALFAFLLLLYWHEIGALIGLNRKPVDSKNEEKLANYVKCQTLKIGMTESDILRIMGKPNEVHYSDVGPQKNKKVLIYTNPADMDDDNRIYIETTTSVSSLIYCCNLEIQ